MGKKIKKLKRKLERAARTAKKISRKAAEYEKKVPSGAEILGFDVKGLRNMPSVAEVVGLGDLGKKKKRRKR